MPLLYLPIPPDAQIELPQPDGSVTVQPLKFVDFVHRNILTGVQAGGSLMDIDRNVSILRALRNAHDGVAELESGHVTWLTETVRQIAWTNQYVAMQLHELGWLTIFDKLLKHDPRLPTAPLAG